MAQWVTLCQIFEVCAQKETGCAGGGRRQAPWWRQTEVDTQLRSTLKDILGDARERRKWESDRLGNREDQQGAGNNEGMI